MPYRDEFNHIVTMPTRHSDRELDKCFIDKCFTDLPVGHCTDSLSSTVIHPRPQLEFRLSSRALSLSACQRALFITPKNGLRVL